MVELITVREAARAVRLSEKQLYAAIAERQFPAVRIGRRIRIPADAVAQWVRAQIEAQNEQTAQGGQADDQGAAKAA